MDDDPLENLTVLVFNEAMRLLHMSNRSVSLAQIQAICTAGPDGALLTSCLAYIAREWPAETKAAGFFRDFHALPPTELAALRRNVSRYCRGSVSFLREPPELDKDAPSKRVDPGSLEEAD